MKIAYEVLSNFSPNSIISILLHIGTLHKNQLLAFTFLFINIDPNGRWYIINMLGLVNHIAPIFFFKAIKDSLNASPQKLSRTCVLNFPQSAIYPFHCSAPFRNRQKSIS